jgi:Sulfotransferase family
MSTDKARLGVSVTETGHRLVFVGGLHRSGTTPLARLLATHAQVSGFRDTGVTEDEGQHLQDVYPSARAYGGPGRFAHRAEAHLTETSPLVSAGNAARLWDEWSTHWDLSRPVLVEKSPPNLIKMRFLQALFPDARFLVLVRHPAVVALSTSKWRRRISLRELVEHWVTAHEILLADAPHVRNLRVVTYEHLIARPEQELAEIADFLDLDRPLSRQTLLTDRSVGYLRQWEALAQSRRPWARNSHSRLSADLEPRVRRFGYSLTDLTAVGDFPMHP